MELLELNKVFKTYHLGEMDLPVLKGVTLSVGRGELVALMGASGSGKSTLMNILGCLDHPTSGEYWLDGQEISGASANERAMLRNRLIGFVFQSFQLIPTLTALENVMAPMELRGQRNAAARARPLLDQVGLGGRISHYPVQLSGGEQQRVGLARAFINQPKILFADEPTGNLDSETGALVIENLFALNAAHATTLIIVTHDNDLAGRAQRVIRLKAGAVVSDEQIAHK